MSPMEQLTDHTFAWPRLWSVGANGNTIGKPPNRSKKKNITKTKQTQINKVQTINNTATNQQQSLFDTIILTRPSKPSTIILSAAGFIAREFLVVNKLHRSRRLVCFFRDSTIVGWLECIFAVIVVGDTARPSSFGWE